MKNYDELLKEKKRLEIHLEVGNDVLVPSELSSIKNQIKEIDLEIYNLKNI